MSEYSSMANKMFKALKPGYWRISKDIQIVRKNSGGANLKIWANDNHNAGTTDIVELTKNGGIISAKKSFHGERYELMNKDDAMRCLYRAYKALYDVVWNSPGGSMIVKSDMIPHLCLY